MKTGSKVLISSVLIIVIALAAALYYVWTSLDSLVEAAIEKYGSQVTQTAVQVQEVKLQKTLAQGKGSIPIPKAFLLPMPLPWVKFKQKLISRQSLRVLLLSMR